MTPRVTRLTALVAALMLALAALGVTALAGCGAPGEGGFGVGDMLLTAGTTQPPAQSTAIEDVYCPTVDVTDGGAALQVRGGGEAGSVRSQITLGEVARECIGQPDGSTLVKIGVEARALLGVGGVLVVSAAFYSIGRSEDEERARRR